MPKPYSPFTISEFGGLRFTSALDRAALEDNEAVQLDNYNLTEMKTLTKRLGWVNANNNVTATATVPGSGVGLVQPTNIRPLAIQRRSPTGSLANRIYFTDTNKADVWTCEADLTSNIWMLVSPTSQHMDGAEWITPAGTPAQPYQLQVCRSTGGMFGINVGGIPTGFTTSPAGTHMSLFKDRLFMINSLHASGQESRVNFSEPKDYGNWPAANNFDVSPADGQFLVSTIVFNDTLIMFKNRSTWILNADGAPTNWVVRNLHPTIGCVGRGTPVIISGFIYFVSNDGVYRTDGTTFERISEPVDGLIRSRLAADASAKVLLRDAWCWDDKYIVSLPDPSTGAMNHKFVYDIRVDAWSRWVMASTSDMLGAVVYQELQTPLLIGGSRTGNKFFTMGNPIYADDSVAYQCNYVSKVFDSGDPTAYKRNYGATVDVGSIASEAGTTGAQITLQKETTEAVNPPNHVPTSDNVGTVNAFDLNRRTLRYPGIGQHKYVGISINNNGTTKWEVFSFSLLNGPPNRTLTKST